MIFAAEWHRSSSRSKWHKESSSSLAMCLRTISWRFNSYLYTRQVLSSRRIHLEMSLCQDFDTVTHHYLPLPLHPLPLHIAYYTCAQARRNKRFGSTNDHRDCFSPNAISAAHPINNPVATSRDLTLHEHQLI